MDAPLGLAVGNALEVIECIETLKGRGPSDLEALSVELAARMVRLCDISATQVEATAKVRQALKSGQGVEKFRQIVAHQGGNPKAVDDYRLMPLAPKRVAVTAERSGYVNSMAAEPIGRAAMLLGAGRDRAEDAVDAGVGAILRVNVGDAVKAGQTMVDLFGRDDGKLRQATEIIRTACHIGDAAPVAEPLIRETIGPT
jgi:thymidine phosphorylase